MWNNNFMYVCKLCRLDAIHITNIWRVFDYIWRVKSVSTQFISLANQTPPTLSFKRIQIFIYHLLPKPSRSFDHLPPSRNNHIHPHNLCVSHFRSIIHPPTLNTEPSPTTWRRTVSKPGNHQRRANNNLEGRRKLENREISKRGEEKKEKTLSKMIYMKTYSIRSPQDPRANARHSGWSSRRVAVRWLSCMPRVRQPRCRSSWRRTGRAAPSSRRRLARRRGTRVDLVAEDGEHLEGVHGGGSRW